MSHFSIPLERGEERHREIAFTMARIKGLYSPMAITKSFEYDIALLGLGLGGLSDILVTRSEQEDTSLPSAFCLRRLHVILSFIPYYIECSQKHT